MQKKLSDLAHAASKKYQLSGSKADAGAAAQAHSAAYKAYREKHAVKPLGNATYTRMKEHGKDADHYNRLASGGTLPGSMSRAG